jgi:hypothetical protein
VQILYVVVALSTALNSNVNAQLVTSDFMFDGGRHTSRVWTRFNQSDGLCDTSFGEIPRASHACRTAADDHYSWLLLHRAGSANKHKDKAMFL